jgi:hypothetical protein
MDAAASKFGMCRDDLRFYYMGDRRVAGDSTPKEFGMSSGDIIEAHLEQKGGKPVIYLNSPTDIDATVRLSLVPSWKLSAHYPIVPVEESGDNSCQTIAWKVSTRSDGTLREHTTGLDVAYLFWEALYVFQSNIPRRTFLISLLVHSTIDLYPRLLLHLHVFPRNILIQSGAHYRTKIVSFFRFRKT